MKKQLLFILILSGISINTIFGQFKLDATGANDMRLRTNNIDRVNILTNGNVGIGTATPNAKLNIIGDLSIGNKLTYTTLGIQNALNRFGSSRIYMNVGGSATLNGIAGGVDGLTIFLYTSAGTVLTIGNNSVSAISFDRIATHTGSDVVINGRGGVTLIYDTALGNWRIIGFADENTSWFLTGNSGTNPANNYMGTNDAQPLVVKTNSTERMRVLSTGEVGISTTLPDSKFHVSDGSAGAVTATPGTVGTFESNSNTYLSVLSPSSALGGMLFASTTGTTRGSVLYSHATDLMTFGTASATRLAIDGSGNVGVGTITPDTKFQVEGTVDNNGTTNVV